MFDSNIIRIKIVEIDISQMYRSRGAVNGQQSVVHLPCVAEVLINGAFGYQRVSVRHLRHPE